MAIVNYNYTLSGGADNLLAADRSRIMVTFTNHSGGDVWLGGANVSDTNGILLAHNTNFTVQQQHPNDHTPGQSWYGYDAGGAGAVIHIAAVTEDATT